MNHPGHRAEPDARARAGRRWRRWVREAARGSRAVSRWVGVAVGAVLLSVVYWGVVTPLGWCWRRWRADPLRRRRRAAHESYWRAARPYSRLDRMF